jgi:hypothetical protein
MRRSVRRDEGSIGVGAMVALVVDGTHAAAPRDPAQLPGRGHLRYFLEAVGPELRQYIVTDNDESALQP